MWDWIVNILFQILKFIQSLAGDWGLSVIILTLIVRLVLAPVLLKSTKSTARMQVYQPKMEEIKQKYADDPQRQQQEIQKFYAENHFNPLGGCMPLLLQMPIMIALFTLLKSLPTYFPDFDKGSFSFYNLLPDLTTSPSASFAQGGASGAAPYLVILVLFGLLSLIPQLYMAKNQTGSQAQSMKMMSVVMAVVMLWFGWALPAGVLLYYDVSSAWQTVQQIFVTQKILERTKAEEEQRLANAPIEVDVVRREHKVRPKKKN
ncbi:membrane protein insertase, YidC/Oxa1 family [Coriobacterium glomerans PW2]|uniref:Membrane protein insertase YidC n=1 Tax=Coriobacterium glomerans (strain ATCC 49209 / DSM 20642 / JCM 10262 / PW2) TaxID=700015 RepID=F2N9E8_CORGP|nr:YidC/Oxa1 family membrane protein insertase [Coriobacterium glomerans]AEB07896.1 membrane protein insertase, YidC/Oxa1 family [Coriobacterium glomerans PW2]